MFGLKTSHQLKRCRGISLVPALFIFLCIFIFCSTVRAKSRTQLKENFLLEQKSSTLISATNPDTTIVKYDINDPRNPDCPCHQAQKLADDEYQRSQGRNTDHNPVNNVDRSNNIDRSNNNDNVNSNANQQNSSNHADVNIQKITFVASSGGSQKHYSKFYKFQKKMKRWSKKMNRKLGKKNNGTKKGKIRIADCYHLR